MTTYPVKAKLVRDVDARKVTPGAFQYYVDEKDGPISGMIYVCPCGCGAQGALKFRDRGREPGERPSWIWDGNEDMPTLEPSVHHVGHWHGWLRNGEWVLS